MATLDDREAGEIRKRYPFFEEVEPRSLVSGSRISVTAVGTTRVMPMRPTVSTASTGIRSDWHHLCRHGKWQFQVNWTEFYSVLLDGCTLRSNNHPNAGALRPLPSAIIQRLPVAKPQELHQFHCA